ncbi:MAG: hypothetical protein RIG84_18295 [Roseovarius sp.]
MTDKPFSKSKQTARDPAKQAAEEAALAPFFDALRPEAAAPSEALMARVLADAAREQAATGADERRPVARPATPPARRLLGWIGGWPVLSGLATATLAGIWIGVNPPAPLAAPVGTLTTALLPGAGAGEATYLVDLDLEASFALADAEGAMQ